MKNICWICGNAMNGGYARGHFEPKQLYAKSMRTGTGPALNLRTSRVHKTCDEAYSSDEEYFCNSLAPFARGSRSGDAFLQDAVAAYSKERRTLIDRVLGEFEHRPHGLILPPNKVAKRFDRSRIDRVALKIVRGLFFNHYGRILPENLTVQIDMVPPWQPLPELAFVALGNQPVHGNHPDVFAYKFANFPEANDLHCWAFFLWERISFIVTFHDPACECAECSRVAA
jgi:hypothetical protein